MPQLVTPIPLQPQMSRAELADLANALGTVINGCLEALNVIAGDADLEPNGDELDGNRSEDDFMHHSANGPGCPIADPDSAVDDRGCDDINDDREPDCDEERETWAHWMDHPAELHIGKRPGWTNDGPKAA